MPFDIPLGKFAATVFINDVMVADDGVEVRGTSGFSGDGLSLIEENIKLVFH